MFWVFLGVNRKSPSILNEIEIKAMSINPKDHSYPFENLVFEGGGAKGYAYSGAIKVQEYIVNLHCNTILMVYQHFCLAQLLFKRIWTCFSDLSDNALKDVMT